MMNNRLVTAKLRYGTISESMRDVTDVTVYKKADQKALTV